MLLFFSVCYDYDSPVSLFLLVGETSTDTYEGAPQKCAASPQSNAPNNPIQEGRGSTFNTRTQRNVKWFS